ncbi:MAG: Transcriptional regulatory protein LiaR [Syntrophorhabdus sp. PtaB.Bin184]|nr:MAG: Transcriptional regulatory protein LiaR [Syntrophorhabdus sp. PtaB.Bin184]
MKQRTLPSDIIFKVMTTLFDTVADLSITLLFKDRTVVWANRGMALSVQRPVEELIGKPCYQAFRRRRSPCPICLLDIVADSKQPLVMERWVDIPHEERKYAEVRAYPILDQHGLVEYLFEILIPITERKKEEEKRSRHIESLERILKDFSAPSLNRFSQIPTHPEESVLTVREKEVLSLIARGFSNKEIARILGISLETMKTHAKNIFFKTDTTDRTEAAVWAITRGII